MLSEIETELLQTCKGLQKSTAKKLLARLFVKPKCKEQESQTEEDLLAKYRKQKAILKDVIKEKEKAGVSREKAEIQLKSVRDENEKIRNELYIHSHQTREAEAKLYTLTNSEREMMAKNEAFIKSLQEMELENNKLEKEQIMMEARLRMNEEMRNK